MVKVIAGLERLPLPTDPFLGHGVLALTDIISDPYPAYSVTPSRCRVTYDRRLIAGETPEGVLAEIRQMPEAAGIDLRVRVAQGEHRTYTGATLSGRKFLPAWLYPPEHPFVRTALAGLQRAGLAPSLSAYGFCTNAAYSAGTLGIPTAGFGPGREADAHVIDERVAVADVIAAERGYRGIIEATLKGGLA
jgi:acetylornithine deacetylase/succinyl-diaminopimelate desuccinylase-like protein